MSIWKTLSAIDCSEHIEKKGQFSYLAWTWAWAMVKENYPTAYYTILDDIVYPDGTMEVRCSVVIEDDKPVEHTMWLPVLDFKNKAIQNPNAFDINSARMRCLVKCLAMFGLGHYIYAGESAPQKPFDKELVKNSVAAVREGLKTEDFMLVRETWDELDDVERDAIWKEFNTREKSKIREFLHEGAKAQQEQKDE